MKTETMNNILPIMVFMIIGICLNGVYADDDVDDCEVISNHTISGIEYRECKDGRLMKVVVDDDSKDSKGNEKLTEIVGIINSDEKVLKNLAKINIDDNDVYFDKHFGKQREVREKLISLQESLKKKRNGDSKNHGRKLGGVVYRHNGFDESSHHHHETEEEESSEEKENVTADAMIKATVEEIQSTSTAAPMATQAPKIAALHEMTLDDGINNFPVDFDVKEMIALGHHKSYHHHEGVEIKNLKPIATHEELPTKTPHHDIQVPHDTVHYGNLRFLDFAPEHKEKENSEAIKDNATPKESSVDSLLPETPNQKISNSNNPYFLTIPNHPIKIQSVEIKDTKTVEQSNVNILNEVRKIFTSDVPTSDFKEHQEANKLFSMTQTQIIIAFAAPIVAFLLYCTIVFFYIQRKRAATQQRKLLPKKCQYQHFEGDDDEATVGFAV